MSFSNNKVVLFRVHDKVKSCLKDIAHRENKTLTSILIEAVNDLLEKYGKKRIAKDALQGRPPKKKRKKNEGTHPYCQRKKMDG